MKMYVVDAAMHHLDLHSMAKALIRTSDQA